MKRGVVLLVASVVVLLLSVGVRGCYDPTEHFVVVYLHNDLDTDAAVTICADPRCNTMPAPTWNDRLAIGADLPVNISTELIASTYKIVLRKSDPVRCLTVTFSPGAPPHRLVPLSSAKPCVEVL